MARPSRSCNKYFNGYYKHLSEGNGLYLRRPRSKVSKNLKVTDVLPEGVYEIERLVAKRVKKGNDEYLVLWRGYRREESSWVDGSNITTIAIHHFNNPDPPLRQIQDSISSLVSGIRKSLKAGTIRQRTIGIQFPIYIFKYLFRDKGRNVPRKSGRLYSSDDFCSNHFRPEDFVYISKTGDGCKVDFPIYMNCHLKWCCESYDTNQQALPSRDYIEILTIFLTKVRFTV